MDSTPRLRRPYAAAMAAVLMRVAICAAVRLYREGLGLALGAVDTVDVVAIVASASEAREELAAAAPEIVLVDAAGPERIEEVRRVVDALPDAKVVALAIPEDAETVLACAEAGVSGFVTRESSLGEVVAMLARRTAVLARDRRHPLAARARPGERARARKGTRPAHPPRARGPRVDRGRAVEQGDRDPALDRGRDGEEPRSQHPREARSSTARPGGGRSRRSSAPADLDPLLDRSRIVRTIERLDGVPDDRGANAQRSGLS